MGKVAFPSNSRTMINRWLPITAFIVALFIVIYILAPSPSTPNTPLSSHSGSTRVFNSNQVNYTAHPVKEQLWGHIYTPSRIWCLVPTLYPRNVENMRAISLTWGRHCTKVVFITDDAVPIADSLLTELNTHANVQILQLDNLNYAQSTEQRNIWEKVWKTWDWVYNHHLNEAEWFLKVDDDTFFSAITFRGMVQYFNPDNSSYYIGHTLFHEWLRRNIVFNAGACYGLSRGVLRRFGSEILSLNSFRNDVQRNHDEYQPYTDESKKRLKWEWRDYCVGNRPFAQEDPTMGICLRSIGINPINSLDRQFRQRFHIFRPSDMAKIKREDTWFWIYQDQRIGSEQECCAEDSISFHSYKVGGDALERFIELDEKYNERNMKRVFDKPWEEPPTLFIFDKESAPEHDEYWNYVNPPPGQRIFKGENRTRECHKCDWFRLK